VALSKGYFTRFFNSPSRRSSTGKLDLGPDGKTLRRPTAETRTRKNYCKKKSRFRVKAVGVNELKKDSRLCARESV
jgi:hypothetical protein